MAPPVGPRPCRASVLSVFASRPRRPPIRVWILPHCRSPGTDLGYHGNAHGDPPASGAGVGARRSQTGAGPRSRAARGVHGLIHAAKPGTQLQLCYPTLYAGGALSATGGGTSACMGDRVGVSMGGRPRMPWCRTLCAAYTTEECTKSDGERTRLVHHQGADFGALAWDRRHPCRPPLAGKDAGGVGPQAAARDGTPLQSNPSETALADNPAILAAGRRRDRHVPPTDGRISLPGGTQHDDSP